MPTSLNDLRVKLLRRLSTLERAFERHVLSPSTSRRVDKFALQEGLVSSLWQAWCEFCRDLVINTTIGASTQNGVLVSSPAYLNRNELEIAYIAKQLSQSRNIGTIRPSAGRHLEPTWGDIDKLLLIVSGLSPTNSGSMMTSISSASAIKDLQIYRNASAHISKENFTKVSATRLRYNNTNFVHPSDAIFWTDPNTQDYLWKTWIDEMELISDFSTR